LLLDGANAPPCLLNAVLTYLKAVDSEEPDWR